MSEESILSFRKLVSAMRTTQKEYWAHRDKKLLKQSLELEKRVDGIIMKADGSAVPENENGSFFLEVATLRTNHKLYFAEKRKAQPDTEQVNQLFDLIKKGEAKVDKMLIHFQDEQARKDGYIIEYHVMERYPKESARSIYSSQDEQLAKIELNDYLRRTRGGCMYFMSKKYVKIQK